jgi:hypothetical protein
MSSEVDSAIKESEPFSDESGHHPLLALSLLPWQTRQALNLAQACWVDVALVLQGVVSW